MCYDLNVTRTDDTMFYNHKSKSTRKRPTFISVKLRFFFQAVFLIWNWFECLKWFHITTSLVKVQTRRYGINGQTACHTLATQDSNTISSLHKAQWLLNGELRWLEGRWWRTKVQVKMKQMHLTFSGNETKEISK